MQFQEHLGEKTPTFFPAEPYICVSYMKHLSKCPYSKKIPVCAPVTYESEKDIQQIKMKLHLKDR